MNEYTFIANKTENIKEYVLTVNVFKGFMAVYLQGLMFFFYIMYTVRKESNKIIFVLSLTFLSN